jgi:release factor glutamine methyltransferase
VRLNPSKTTASERETVAAAMRDGLTRFMGLELIVAAGTLVPRAETELLAQTAIALLPPSDTRAARVVDMCCGAANLACAIAHHSSGSRVWACDLTEACVQLALRNTAFCGLSERISVHQGDLFGALAGLGLEGSADMVVCNPPYISQQRLADEHAQLLELEPREAFEAGPYGLSVHQRVVNDAAAFLRPGGALLVEVGLGQHRQVRMLFERSKAYEDVEIVNNEAGEARVVLGRRRIA